MPLFKGFKQKFQAFLEKSWYSRSLLGFCLWPVAKIYQLVSFLRRLYLQSFKQHSFPVPVIVIGNISVGGVGKTPLVIAIAEKITERGLKVGIVSRGYGAKISDFPHLINTSDKARLVGDEPLLLAIRTTCPVVIDPNRVRAVQYLIDNFSPDVILSDDGLQHYGLDRSIEIAVVDGSRGLGNGLHLPAGPLRESGKRLSTVDFVISNGGCSTLDFLQSPIHTMQLEPLVLCNCVTGQKVNVDGLGKNTRAIAAIGNPERFFKTLRNFGLTTQNYSYPDHYQYTDRDFTNISESIVMTEKDFVKCKEFANPNMYYLPVVAKLADTFWDSLFKHPKLIKFIDDNVNRDGQIDY